MRNTFNEDSRVKLPALIHLCRLGYRYVSIKSLDFDVDTNISRPILKEKLSEFNPSVTPLKLDLFIDKLNSILDNDDLGREFYSLLTATSGIKLVDFDNPYNNDFACVTEFTCKNGDDEFRPDITLLINGLPLSFIEVKKPNNKEGILAERDRINKRFKNRRFRRFLNLCQLMIFSNNQEYDVESIVPIQGAFYATNARDRASFNCFRESDNSFYDKVNYQTVSAKDEQFIHRDNNSEVIMHTPEYQTNKSLTTPTNKIITSLLSIGRIIYMLKYSFVYVDQEQDIEKPDGTIDKVRILQKHVMRYQQLFATYKIERMLDAGTKSGIIWHTQGSGKTALAYYNIKRLYDYYAKKSVVPKFYFIVDRLDLLNQSLMEFEDRGLSVNVVKSKDELMKQFSINTSVQNKQGALEVTVVNIQKFKEEKSTVSVPDYAINMQRVYFIDEAHRGYKFDGSFLANLLDSDRNAIKIALTGTPLIGEEHNSCKVFGNYIDKYYYNQSISDGYTLKLIREDIESNYKMQIEQVLADIRIKKKDVKREQIFSEIAYVKAMLEYILLDMVRSRNQLKDNTIGGMIVCDSNMQAETMFSVFKDMQEQHGLRACLILHDEDDSVIRKKNINNFKKTNTVDFLIVNKMLLTGFDAPRLKKLYLGRRIKDHNLLQALTRVNRPYKEFKYGYIVDFADISEDFAETNKAYLAELYREVGEENYNEAYTNLFESNEAVVEQLKDIKEVLFSYDFTNAEEFRIQLDQIDDRKEVLEIKKSLEQARALSNTIRSFGDDELKEKFSELGFDRINEMYNVASSRLDTLNLKANFEHQDEVGNIINEAMATITFSFYKVGEEELRMVGEDYEEEFQKVTKEFVNNFDQEDEGYITLAQAFKDYFKKRGLEPNNVADAKAGVEYMKEVMAKIREINRRNSNLQRMYQGDEKFARVHKRVVERGIISKRESEVCDILNRLKSDIDGQIMLNSAILQNDFYFEGVVKRLVGVGFNELKIKAELKDKKDISELISRQYLNQYHTVRLKTPPAYYDNETIVRIAADN
ncbi:MAG: type I restriction endonuclease [bacterium]